MKFQIFLCCLSLYIIGANCNSFTRNCAEQANWFNLHENQLLKMYAKEMANGDFSHQTNDMTIWKSKWGDISCKQFKTNEITGDFTDVGCGYSHVDEKFISYCIFMKSKV